jgi:hypothetical protein
MTEHPMAGKWGLSIDPNTHQTGMIEWLGDQPMARWVIRAADWLEMQREICRFIDGHHQSPRMLYDWVACESVYLASHKKKLNDKWYTIVYGSPQVYGILSRLVGCIQGHCDWHGYTYLEGTVAEINAAVGASTRLPRAKREKAMLTYAEPRIGDLGEEPLTVDEAAALWCGEWALRQLERRDLERTQDGE